MLNHSYGIVGDNLDLFIRVKHMASDNQNKSIHWFNLLGLINRVSESDFNNEQPIKAVDDIKISDLVPSKELHQEHLKDLISIVACIVVEKIPAFSEFRKLVIRHIPHKYSEITVSKIKEVIKQKHFAFSFLIFSTVHTVTNSIFRIFVLNLCFVLSRTPFYST